MEQEIRAGKTGGTPFMQRSLIRMFSHFDPLWVYPVVAVWVIGYILFVPNVRRGNWCYWRRIRRCGFFSSVWNLYLSFFEFGKVIMDRFAMYAHRHIDVTVVNREALDTLLKDGKGCVMMGSHIGNMEEAGCYFKLERDMYALAYIADTETVIENKRECMQSGGIHLIPVMADGSHVFEVHNILSGGNFLLVHCDRIFPWDRPLNTTFLGAEASFPEGPYRIATAEAVPVFSTFMMRDGRNRYTLYIEQLSDGSDYKGASRLEQERELLSRQAAAMERILEKYPHQWFNFYNFWDLSNGNTPL